MINIVITFKELAIIWRNQESSVLLANYLNHFIPIHHTY